jgi:hypothetical protein
MWYMPKAACAGTQAMYCKICLYMKIFVCFYKQISLLAFVSKFGGGVDKSILWLSFAKQ